jgi:3-hydroxy-9,10-secoandrosta-1,3,5(10)-triene-9,17-dione monooxygenase reductase component
VRLAGRFGDNVRRAPDAELAAVFASKRVAREKFDSVTHSEAHGVPVLDSALAWISCELRELLPGGDHVIGIGEVTGMGREHAGDPLVYFRGRYATIAS